MKNSLRLFSFIGAFVLLHTVSIADATWFGSSSNLWSDSLSWSSGHLPADDLVTDTVIINNGFSGGIVVDKSQSIAGINFGNSGTYVVFANTHNTLTLGAKGIVTFSGSQQIISGSQLALFLGTDSSFTVNASGGLVVGTNLLFIDNHTLTLNGNGIGLGQVGSAIVGTGGGVTKADSGTWVLSGANAYTGVTKLSGGTLSVATIGDGGVVGNLGSASSLSSNLVFDGGTLLYTGGDASSNRNFIINANKTATVEVTAANLTLSGASTATNGNLTKTGAGTLTLSGQNLYSGRTTVSAGTLALGASNALGSGDVTVNGGNLDLGSNHSDTVGAVILTNGSITGTGTSTLTSTTAFDLSSGAVSANLAGSVQLDKSDSGTVILTGANTYTGFTIVSGGTLQVGNGGTTGSLGSGSVFINSGELAFNRSDNVTFSGPISANLGTLTQAGTGTLALTGSDNITGHSSILAGTLQIGAGGATGSLTGDIVDNAALIFNRSDSTSYFGVISGAGTVTKLGAGTLTLNGASTYSGLTTVSGGTLALGVSNALGSGAVTVNGGTLALGSNHSDTVGTVTLANGSITGTGTSALTSTGSFELQSGAVGVNLAGTGATLNKTTAGTVTLAGVNTTTGTTTVSGGTLVYGVSNALGSGAVTVNAGTLDLGSNHTDTVGTVTLANNGSITGTGTSALTSTGTFEMQKGTVSAILAGNGIALNKTTTGTVTLTGNNTYSGLTTISAGTLQLGSGGTSGSVAGDIADNVALVFNRSDNVVFGGAISGSGNVTQSGTGILTLNAANTFSGTTTINAGTLAAGTSNALGSGAVTVNGGILDLGTNHSDTVGTVTLTNGSITGTGSSTLTSTGSFQVSNGAVSAILAGTGIALTKNTSGTVILSGNNTYTGATNITNGTLQLGDGGTAGSVAGNISVASNATLVFDRSDNVNYGGVISGLGSVTQAGAGTVTLNAANTFSGTTTVSAGTLAFGVSNALGGGSLVVSGGTLDLGSNHSGTVHDFTLTAGSITGSGTSTLTSNSFAMQSGLVTLALAGTGALTKTTADTVILSANNTYSGATSVNAGTLQLGAGDTTGSVLGNIAVASNATLAFDRSDDFTFSKVISGAGSFAQLGTGTVTMTAANTYSGLTTVSSGTLAYGASNVLASGGVLVNGGTLALGNNHSDTVGTVTLDGGAITGSGTSTLTSTSFFDLHSGTVSAVLAGAGITAEIAGGAVVFTGNNTYTGLTTVDSGLIIGDGGTTGSVAGDMVVGDSAYLEFKRSDNFAYAGAINGTNGTMVKNGAGTLTLNGAVSFSGDMDINAGTLVLTNFTGRTVNTINAGAALEFAVASGVADYLGSGANQFYGDGTLIKAGAGTVQWSKGRTIFSMSAGSLIDLQGGTFVGGGFGGEQWAGNASTLNVAANAVFVGRSANVQVDALTGAGTITSGSAGTSYKNFTFGVANGSGDFAGSLRDDSGGAAGNYVKVGTGTQTLSGTNLFTGTMTVSAGTLQIGNGGTGGSVIGNIVDNAALVFNRSDSSTYAGVISGSGSVTKAGAGGLMLTGTNTNTGLTTVSAGTLYVNGSLGATHVTVDAGATLGGSGTIKGLTTIASGGHLAPGNSPGTLTFTNGLTLDSGAILDFQLGTISDFLRVTGGLVSGPNGFGAITLNLSDSGGFDPLAGGDFTLFDFAGATLNGLAASDFTFGSVLAGTDLSAYSLTLADSKLFLAVSARSTGTSTVPDSGPSLAVFASVLLGLCASRRKSA